MPNWGLVCITRSDRVRFHTLTRTRYLKLSEEERFDVLEELYCHNLQTLFGALDFCAEHSLRLYRMSANLFPLADWEDGIGQEVLESLKSDMASFGPKAEEYGIRVVIHPEQFVVLNSERPKVIATTPLPSPRFDAIVERLSEKLEVQIWPEDPFIAPQKPLNLGSHAKYWWPTKNQAFQTTKALKETIALFDKDADLDEAIENGD